jgi:hypothetical protein
MPDTAKLSAALAEIGARFGSRPGDVERLLAAVDAVLELHQMEPGMFPPQCTVCVNGDNDFGDLMAEIWPCPTVRAISRALLGEESPDA